MIKRIVVFNLFFYTLSLLSGVPGDIDISFGTGGGLLIPGGQTVYPESMKIESSGDIVVGICNTGASELVGLTSAYVLHNSGPNAFGSGGSGVTQALRYPLITIKNIMTDVAGNLYIVGDNGTTSALNKMPGNGSTITWSSATNVSFGNAVAQQASGRILVAGYDSSYNEGTGSGVIISYTPAGDLDISFNQNSSTPGYFYTGIATQITSISVGAYDSIYADKIYFSYVNESNYAIVNRLLENGYEDTSFTFVMDIADVAATNQLKMQLDIDGNIFVIANIDNGFVAQRYNADGTNSGGNSAGPLQIFLNNPTTATLENILCLSDGTTLFVGSNLNGNNLILGRVTSNFVLDNGFATAGLLQTPVTSPVTMVYFYAIGMSSTSPYDILITADDGINPYLIGVLSGLSSAVTAVNQSTSVVGASGTLDTTFNVTGTNSGFLNLHTELTTNLVAGNSVKSLLQNADGSYFIAADNGANSYITKMDATDLQDTTFNVATLTNKSNVSNLLVSQSNNLLVLGGLGASGSDAGWLMSLNATNGTATLDFTVTDVLDGNFAIAQQSNGRIIVGGIEDGFGTLIAYNSLTGAVDKSFGINGRYTTSYPYKINTVIIDNQDNIFSMVNEDGFHIVAVAIKISSDGTSVLAQAGFTPWSDASALNHLAFDMNNNLFAVTTNGTDFNIFHYSSSDLSELGGSNLATSITGISTPIVTTMMVNQQDSSGNIIITGYDAGVTPAVPFVAKILGDLSGFDTSFNGTGYQIGYGSGSITSTTGAAWHSGFMSLNGKITVGGYEVISGADTAYLMRLYGTEFIGQYLPNVSAGYPGTIDTHYGTAGQIIISNISGCSTLVEAQPQVVLPIENGSQYIAFTNGKLILLTNGNLVDTSFGPTSNGFASPSPSGLHSMFIDGNGCLVTAGTKTSSPFNSWIARYVTGSAGTLDPTFGVSGIVTLDYPIIVSVVRQQTIARYLAVGKNARGAGAVFAYTNTGEVDATFNSNSENQGMFDTGVAYGVYCMVLDLYDRIIIAYKNGSAIDLCRLTSSGQIDDTFGVNGIISSAITGADNTTQVKVTLDSQGNIIVVAHTTISSHHDISIVAYQNTTGTNMVYPQLNIGTLTNPTLTDLIATSDSNVLISGYQSGTNDLWVASITIGGALDLSFNPYGVVYGIMNFYFDPAASSRVLNSIAIYPDGEISMVGYKVYSGVTYPCIARAYDTPYITQIPVCQNSLPVGTNNQTLGLTDENGVVFFGTATADITYNQIAQAVALQDDETMFVVVNGEIAPSGSTDIIINSFSIDGLLNPSFNPGATGVVVPGQAVVLSMFDDQFAVDMMIFSIEGIYKAILCGYAYNTTLLSYNSLLMQYVLSGDQPGLDPDFGGFNGDSLGVATGNISSQAFTVGQQSIGRIIIGGKNPSSPTQGFIQAYTAQGLLDQSFGQDGSFTQGSTGIYASVIDQNDSILIAYADGSGNLFLARILSDGSGLDQTFGADGIYFLDYGNLTANNSFRIVLDQLGNIFVAAVLESATAIAINKLDSNGQGIIASTTFTSLDLGTLNNFVITKLLFNQAGALVTVGYDTNQIVIVQTIQDRNGIILLDPAFNTEQNFGYLKYEISEVRTIGFNHYTAGATINPNGTLIITGHQQSLPS